MTFVIRVACGADHEIRLLVASGRDIKSCLVSCLFLAAGVAYLVGPVDLVPHSHIDELALLIISIGTARYLLPEVVRARAQPVRDAADLRRHWRKRVLACTAAAISAPVLRLCIGRWPDERERQLFRVGFVSGEAIVPPILRGLHSVPASKEPLGQLAVLNLVREGVVRKPPDLGPHRMAMPAFPGNPLSYWRGSPISFLHFEKTAGTSLANLLTGLFHPLQIDDDPERGTAPHVLSAFPPTIRDDIRRKSLVWGHYDLPALHRLGPERRIVTMLREPQARVLSLYHFWRSVDPSLIDAGFVGFNVSATHELDLLNYLKSADPLIRNYIDNVYVRRLAGAYIGPDGDDPLRRDPDATVRRALAGLRTIAFVGIVERMDTSLDALGRAIGVDLTSELPRRNTADSNQAGAAPGFRRIGRELVTPAVTAELERLTCYDELVYRERASVRLD